MFITPLINFLIIALVVFFLILRPIAALQAAKENCRAGATGNQRMPFLLYQHPGKGFPLPQLYSILTS